MGNRAFIYCRISQDREGAGLGVDRQREDCERLAEQLGYTVAEVFTDNDTSAYSVKPRKGYRAMLARIAEVDAVIVWHTDRLHRSPVELEEWIDATGGERRARVQTLTVQAGSLDLSTADGRLRARISGVVARHESEHKAERARRKMEQIARSGGWTGGARPFGWDVVPRDRARRGEPQSDLLLNEPEASVVREATAAVIRGQSLGSLVASLNARGILTTAGKPWGYAQLRQMLLRPRNAGIATYRGEEVGRTQAPPIVSEAQFRAVVGILGDPKRRRSQSNKARHLLAGIARCHCGLPVRSATVTNRRGEKLFVYRCPAKGPGHVGKRIAYVDPLVTEYARFAIPSTLAPAESPDLDALRLDLDAERIVLDSDSEAVARMAGDGVLLPDQVRTANARIVARREDLRARMVEVERAAARGLAGRSYAASIDALNAAVALWSGWTVDERRAFIRTHLDVVLLPAPGKAPRQFHAETVRVRWADDADGDSLADMFRLLGTLEDQLASLPSISAEEEHAERERLGTRQRRTARAVEIARSIDQKVPIRSETGVPVRRDPPERA